MEDTVRLAFESPLSLEEMLGALAGISGIDFQSLDGPAGGYLRGLTANGVKIRLVPAGGGPGGYAAEIFFPVGPGWTRFDDAQKEDFVAWSRGTLLAAARATAIRNAP